MTAIIRGKNITAEQLQRLLKQAPTNAQAAKKAARGAYEADIETTIVRAMQLDGWRALKQEYNFDLVKKLTLGEPGMCDHQFMRPLYGPGSPPDLKCTCGVKEGCACCQLLWWEFKASARRRKRREYLSTIQTLWTEAEKKAGFLVWIAGVDHEATVDGAAQHYLGSGLARNRAPFVALIPPEGRALPDRDRRLGDG